MAWFKLTIGCAIAAAIFIAGLVALDGVRPAQNLFERGVLALEKIATEEQKQTELMR